MRVCFKNFTGGEISDTLLARYDLAKYQNSLLRMENFFPNTHSNAVRRSGMRYIANIGENTKAVLMPFIFNTKDEQNFVLVFTHKKFSVYGEKGLIAGEMDSPYAEDDLYMLNYAQVADVVYIAHEKYPLQKLLRKGTYPYVWKIEAVSINKSLPAPGSPSCVWNETPPSQGQTYPPRNYWLRYKIVAIDNNGVQSVGSAPGAVAGRYPTEWVVGDYVDISWNAVSGAKEYNIYRESAGYYGYIGTADTTSFRDNNYEPDIADTPQENWFPFANGNNPRTVTFHQQRMVLAGTKKEPQTVYMSRVGDFENFRKSRPLQDDDPIEYTLASNSIDDIQWVTSFKDLLIGTSGSEFKVTGTDGTGSVITAKGISIMPQSFWGSADLFPIVIGTSMLHAQRFSSKVRDLFYSLETDGYAGTDLTALVPHLFEGHTILQWAYQQYPDSILWCVRDDGVLLAMNYIKEQQIVGWSVHRTAGKVKSVCRISGDRDKIFVIVERETDGRKFAVLEMLEASFSQHTAIEDAFFVDSGVTLTSEEAKTEWDYPEHLKGQNVVLLVDGSPVETFSMIGENRFTIDYPAKTVTVGLPYRSILAPLPVNADMQSGSTLGMKRSYGQCAVKLHRSINGKYGADLEMLDELPFIPERYGEAAQPFSGDIYFTPYGGQDENATIYIVQDDPLPMQIVGIVANIDFGQQG